MLPRTLPVALLFHRLIDRVSSQQRTRAPPTTAPQHTSHGRASILIHSAAANASLRPSSLAPPSIHRSPPLSSPPSASVCILPPVFVMARSLLFSIALLSALLWLSSAQMEFELYSPLAADADYSTFLTYAPPAADYFDAADNEFQLYAELPVLTRPALFKQRQAQLEQATIPTMKSTERFTHAPAITQKTLTETRPEMLQTVKAHPSYEMRPAETKQAAIPVLLSTERVERAAPITQKTLTETRAAVLQTVKAHPSYEMRPALTEAAAVPLMQSTEQVQQATPITQKTLTETRPTIVQEAPPSQKKQQ